MSQTVTEKFNVLSWRSEGSDPLLTFYCYISFWDFSHIESNSRNHVLVVDTRLRETQNETNVQNSINIQYGKYFNVINTIGVEQQNTNFDKFISEQ